MTDSQDGEGTLGWGDLVDEATARLRSAGVPSAEVDARRIVEEVSGHEGAELLLRRDERVGERAVARFDQMLARRSAGEPLQYVLGRWGFRTLDLAVDARALIPRPETEMLVEVALGHVDRIVASGGSVPLTVVDLGCGSGAIALSIAAERVSTLVIATDQSPQALALARSNLAGLGRAGARVTMVEGWWFDAIDPSLAGAVDVIVSNPPYVLADDPLPAEVEDWEPVDALRSGADGLDDLRVIVAGAPAWLRAGGALAVELDPRQASTVADLMVASGFIDVAITNDLVGRARIVSGVRPN